jgi:L-cysteate sulfo-lyase
MTNHSVKFRSIPICACDEGGWMSPTVICPTVKTSEPLRRQIPPDQVIRAELDVDQRFFGEDYAVPQPRGSAPSASWRKPKEDSSALSNVPKADPGMLNHIREGRVQHGSSV